MAMISSALITRYFLTLIFDLGSCVFSVDHTVARLYLYRYFFTVYDLTATYCDNLCLLGFLLGAVRKYDAGCGFVFCLKYFTITLSATGLMPYSFPSFCDY